MNQPTTCGPLLEAIWETFRSESTLPKFFFSYLVISGLRPQNNDYSQSQVWTESALKVQTTVKNKSGVQVQSLGPSHKNPGFRVKVQFTEVRTKLSSQKIPETESLKNSSVVHMASCPRRQTEVETCSRFELQVQVLERPGLKHDTQRY